MGGSKVEPSDEPPPQASKLPTVARLGERQLEELTKALGPPLKTFVFADSVHGRVTGHAGADGAAERARLKTALELVTRAIATLRCC